MNVRLQKVLAQSGLASRRRAEEMIREGRVEVNGVIVRELGTKVDPDADLVRVDGKPLPERESKVHFVFYKPPGVVTTFSDPQGRPTVKDYLSQIPERVFAVGRLDYDAEGALLLTNDGELANRLMHPRFEVPRTYLVKVKGMPDAPTLEKLRSGVMLEDGLAKPVEVAVQGPTPKNTWIRLVVSEGRPHLIKRMCAAIGHPAVRLYRPEYAGIAAEGLAPGAYRALTPEEVVSLSHAGPETVGISYGPTKLPPRRHGRGPIPAPVDEREESSGGDAEELPADALPPHANPPAAKEESKGHRGPRGSNGPARFSKVFRRGEGRGRGEKGRPPPSDRRRRPERAGFEHQRTPSWKGGPNSAAGDIRRPAREKGERALRDDRRGGLRGKPRGDARRPSGFRPREGDFRGKAEGSEGGRPARRFTPKRGSGVPGRSKDGWRNQPAENLGSRPGMTSMRGAKGGPRERSSVGSREESRGFFKGRPASDGRSELRAVDPGRTSRPWNRNAGGSRDRSRAPPRVPSAHRGRDGSPSGGFGRARPTGPSGNPGRPGSGREDAMPGRPRGGPGKRPFRPRPGGGGRRP